MKKIICASLVGGGVELIEAEGSYVRGLPGFSIVGLGGASIQESKERVKAALHSIGFKFPAQKVTINLSPSDIKKEGSHFDLPIALLIALEKDECVLRDDIAIFGELGLDGKLKDTPSIFACILSLVFSGQIKKVIIPKESFSKVSKIPGVQSISCESLEEVILKLRDQENLKFESGEDLSFDFIEVGGKKYYYANNYDLDFSDVLGQRHALRASLISTVGMHNILFEGSPGCGKSMCAKRIPYIMPPLSIDEILQNAKTQSFDDSKSEFKALRAFRSPHHSSSKPSIFGGGSGSAKMGEVALAHNGVLFFDEFPHFSKSVLESLREPLEDFSVLISRVQNKIKYDTKFLFVAAQNPCPCGNMLSTSKECRCSDLEISRYKNRVSDPLYDRIDLYVKMDEVAFDAKSYMDSKSMHELVKKAFVRQKNRFQSELNGKLSDQDINKYCVLEDEAMVVLNQAIGKFDLTARGKNKTLKVARSIADLDDKDLICKSHILEALSFRRR